MKRLKLTILMLIMLMLVVPAANAQPFSFSLDSIHQLSYQKPILLELAPIISINFLYFNSIDSNAKYLNVILKNPNNNEEMWGIRNLGLIGFHSLRDIEAELTVAEIGFEVGDPIQSIKVYYIISDTIYNTPPDSSSLYQSYTVNLSQLSFGGFVSSSFFFSPYSLEIVKTAEPVKGVIRGCAIPVINLDASKHNPRTEPGYAGDKNACGPAACANSFEWLEKMHPKEINSGLSHRQKLVKFSELMKRPKEEGIHLNEMIRGKLDFIDQYKLPVHVKFQAIERSASIPSPNPKYKHRATNESRLPADTNFVQYKRLDWEWIYNEMEKGEDVEVNIKTGTIRSSDGALVSEGFHTFTLTGIQGHIVEGKLLGGRIFYKDDNNDLGPGGNQERISSVSLRSDGLLYLNNLSGKLKIKGVDHFLFALIISVVSESYDPKIKFTFMDGDTMIGPGNLRGSDRLGFAVDIYKNYAIAGAPLTANKKGAAHTFFKDNGLWIQQDFLMADDSTEGDKFGYAVHTTENYAIVGVPENNDNGTASGAAYIFERSGLAWSQVAKLVPSDNQQGDFFGYSVAIAGDYAVAGALGDDDAGAQSGSIYIYGRNGSGNWVEIDKKIASDGDINDYFGFDVDMTPDDIIVGAHRNSDGGRHSGSAYIFNRSGSTWNEQQKLVASDTSPGDSFGFSVGIYGDDAIIGAVGHDGITNNGGAAYVFTRNGSTWNQQGTFTSSDVTTNDQFGSDVKLTLDSAIIGVFMDEPNGPRSGSAYIFTRGGSTWSEDRKLTSLTPYYLDDYGRSAGISETFAMIGSSGDDTKGINKGAVYFYNLTLSPMLVRNDDFQKFTSELTTSRAEAITESAAEIQSSPEVVIAGKQYEANGLQIYPNPTRGEVTIAWPASAGTGTVDVLDGSGKLVSQFKSEGFIQTSGLQMGVYTIRIQIAGEVHYRRLVVVK